MLHFVCDLTRVVDNWSLRALMELTEGKGRCVFRACSNG